MSVTEHRKPEPHEHLLADHRPRRARTRREPLRRPRSAGRRGATASPSPTSRRPSRWPGAALLASGIGAGRPGRDLGAERRASGSSRRSPCTRRAPWSYRSTRASRAAEAAYVLDRADVRMLLHGQRVPRHELRRGAAATAPPVPSLREIVVLRGERARHDDVGRRSSRARPGRRGRAVRPAPLRSAPTTSATSSSRRAPPGSRRARCSPTAPTVRAYTAWSDVVGLREGDRYLIVNPFFHSFGLNAGILASLLQGRDDHPARGVRRRRGDAARRARST